MTTNEFNELKQKINNAELNSANAKGKMESIQENWKSTYGFDTVEQAEAKLNEIETENKNQIEKREKLFQKLTEMCNFD
jgi:inosine/xanthosine triphosphate pyrophosphatase family protein